LSWQDFFLQLTDRVLPSAEELQKMHQSNEVEYFMLRERQERALAERCEDVTARRCHLDMARRYRERLTAAQPQAAA
jgi:hypothetical protein